MKPQQLTALDKKLQAAKAKWAAAWRQELARQIKTTAAYKAGFFR